MSKTLTNRVRDSNRKYVIDTQRAQPIRAGVETMALDDASKQNLLATVNSIHAQATKLSYALKMETQNPQKLTKKSKYICEVCSKEYTNRQNLSRHKKVKHLHQHFECKWCKRTYTSMTNLKRHLTLAKFSLCKNKTENNNMEITHETPQETPETPIPSVAPPEVDILELALTLGEYKRELHLQLLLFQIRKFASSPKLSVF